MSRRTERVGDLLQTEIADLLFRQVKHPVLAGAMLSIIRVEVASDFSRARVHISAMFDAVSTDGGSASADGGDDDREREVMAALERTEPYLHRELVKRLHMRRIPRLRFIADHSIAEGDRMSKLMHDLARSEGREP